MILSHLDFRCSRLNGPPAYSLFCREWSCEEANLITSSLSIIQQLYAVTIKTHSFAQSPSLPISSVLTLYHVLSLSAWPWVFLKCSELIVSPLAIGTLYRLFSLLGSLLPPLSLTSFLFVFQVLLWASPLGKSWLTSVTYSALSIRVFSQHHLSCSHGCGRLHMSPILPRSLYPRPLLCGFAIPLPGCVPLTRWCWVQPHDLVRPEA